MAKSMQVNIGGAMKKVKAIYINIGGTLHKVKKGVVNIGNSIKEFFTSQLKITQQLSTKTGTARDQGAGTGVGNYLLFAGGLNSSFNPVAEILSVSVTNYTTSTSLATMTQSRCQLGACTIKGTSSSNSYAIFAGGRNAGTGYYNTVNGYQGSNLTRVSSISTLPTRSALPACASFNSRALIAGGRSASNGYPKDVTTYNTALTRATLSDLTSTSYMASAAVAGNYCLIAEDDCVESYNSSFVKGSVSQTFTGGMRRYTGAMTVNNNAVFAGGHSVDDDTNIVTTVDFYNASLVRLTPAQLGEKSQYYNSGITVNGYGVLVGGANSKGGNQMLYSHVISPDLTITFNNSTSDIRSTYYLGSSAETQDGMTGGHFGGEDGAGDKSNALFVFTME